MSIPESIHRRIIGETPKANGGIVAIAHIPPQHLGRCVMRFRVDGASCAVIFPNYKEARSAAIRAIFSNRHSFDSVVIANPLQTETDLPFYDSAGLWFQTIK